MMELLFKQKGHIYIGDRKFIIRRVILNDKIRKKDRLTTEKIKKDVPIAVFIDIDVLDVGDQISWMDFERSNCKEKKQDLLKELYKSAGSTYDTLQKATSQITNIVLPPTHHSSRGLCGKKNVVHSFDRTGRFSHLEPKSHVERGLSQLQRHVRGNLSRDKKTFLERKRADDAAYSRELRRRRVYQGQIHRQPVSVLQKLLDVE